MLYKYPEIWTEDKFSSLSGEDDRFEWKLGKISSQSDENKFRNKLAQELGAFANSFGGTLFIGVADDKEIIGVSEIWRGRQTTKEWLENIIPTLFELRLQHFRVSLMELTEDTQNNIDKDKVVLAIDVLDSELAPHQCVFDKKYYYRVSSKSEPAPHHYLAFLWSRTNSNMSQVANWWFVSFLDPIITLLSKLKDEFNNNSFPLEMRTLAVYATSHSYFRINFFDDENWNKLITSDAGEYFLNTFPLIEAELINFRNLIMEFITSFLTLEQSILNAPQYLAFLLEFYERLIKNERVPREQYENKNITGLSQLIVGQLRSQLSNYPDESRDSLLRNVAYFLLDINITPPEMNVSEEMAILNAGKSIAESISKSNYLFTETIQETKHLFELVQTKSLTLWLSLKKERIALAKRYTATFGQFT